MGVDMYEDYVTIKHKPEIKMAMNTKHWDDDVFYLLNSTRPIIY